MRLRYLSIWIFLFITIIFIGGCISEESPTKVPVITQPIETQSQTPTELNLNVGETAKTSKIEVTVFSAQKTKSYDYYSDILEESLTEEVSPGNIYILIEAEIKNIGSDSAFVGSSEFSITDSEGYKYDSELYYGDDDLEMFKELYQNQKMRGKLLFKIPEDAQNLKLQYDFGNLLTGTKLASWSIN